MEEPVQAALHGVSLGYGKSAWSWVISDKKYRVGTAKVKNPVAAELIALQQLMDDLPDRKPLIIRTAHREVAVVVGRPNDHSANPLIRSVREKVLLRAGSVRVVLVAEGKEEKVDSLAVRLTGKAKEATARTKKSPSPVASTRRRSSASRPSGIITTELDEDLDAVQKGTSRGSKPVTCPSCDMPVHPLTMECGCSS